VLIFWETEIVLQVLPDLMVYVEPTQPTVDVGEAENSVVDQEVEFALLQV